MNEVNLLAQELLKLDGLKSGEASKALLEQIRSIQTKAEQRERFWFRMASGFWITLALLFLIVTVLSAVEAYEPQVTLGGVGQALRPGFVVALFGGLFSSVHFVLTRRQAGQDTMQMTLAALTQEIRELRRQQERYPESD